MLTLRSAAGLSSSKAMSKLRNSENADRICGLLSEGYSLRQVVKEIGQGSAGAIRDWAREDDAFGERYTRAMHERWERLSEETLEIADDGTNDWVQREQDGRTVTVADHEHIQRSKLRVDTRKWLLSKMVPRVYGDRVSAEITGKDGKDLIPPEAVDPGRLALALLSIVAKPKGEEPKG